MAQTVNNLPATQETRVQSLGGEDPMEGHGHPLQYSCLENSMDRGGWQRSQQSMGLQESMRLQRVRHPCSDLEYTQAEKRSAWQNR